MCTADRFEPTNGMKLKGSESRRFRSNETRRVKIESSSLHRELIIDWEKSSRIGFFFLVLLNRESSFLEEQCIDPYRVRCTFNRGVK